MELFAFDARSLRPALQRKSHIKLTRPSKNQPTLVKKDLQVLFTLSFFRRFINAPDGNHFGETLNCSFHHVLKCFMQMNACLIVNDTLTAKKAWSLSLVVVLLLSAGCVCLLWVEWVSGWAILRREGETFAMKAVKVISEASDTNDVKTHFGQLPEHIKFPQFILRRRDETWAVFRSPCAYNNCINLAPPITQAYWYWLG